MFVLNTCQRDAYRYRGVILCFFACIIIFCATHLTHKRNAPFFQYDHFEDGDIVFVHGKTWRSSFVRFLGRTEGVEGYSHVGIVKIVDYAPQILHATPESKIVTMDSPGVFLSSSEIERADVYRVSDKNLAMKAGAKAWEWYLQKIRFDARFDLFEESAVYCTEFVWRAYTHAGLELIDFDSNVLHDSGIYGKVLLPETLSRSVHLTRVMTMK